MKSILKAVFKVYLFTEKHSVSVKSMKDMKTSVPIQKVPHFHAICKINKPPDSTIYTHSMLMFQTPISERTLNILKPYTGTSAYT